MPMPLPIFRVVVLTTRPTQNQRPVQRSRRRQSAHSLRTMKWHSSSINHVIARTHSVPHTPGSSVASPSPSDLSTSSLSAFPSPYQYPACPTTSSFRHAVCLRTSSNCCDCLKRRAPRSLQGTEVHSPQSSNTTHLRRRRVARPLPLPWRDDSGLAQRVNSSSSPSQQLRSVLSCVAFSPPSSSSSTFTAPSTAPFSSLASSPLPTRLSAGRVPSLLHASESLRVFHVGHSVKHSSRPASLSVHVRTSTHGRLRYASGPRPHPKHLALILRTIHRDPFLCTARQP
ncbi:hypothetical protein C8R45DRAFT_574817 [Mycena sanguinolenta]|nr:hypothetical protein C8R45DRAFT_574817 [Mycena sanguinolenta]